MWIKPAVLNSRRGRRLNLTNICVLSLRIEGWRSTWEIDPEVQEIRMGGGQEVEGVGTVLVEWAVVH